VPPFLSHSSNFCDTQQMALEIKLNGNMVLQILMACLSHTHMLTVTSLTDPTDPSESHTHTNSGEGKYRLQR